MGDIILKAFNETVFMTFYSTIFSVILGFILAVILTISAEDGLRPNKIIYKVLDVIINILRSFPFIILMVFIIPLTRAIVGTSIGKEAAIVPLTFAAAPFVARIIESSLREVDKGVIEAAKSFGANYFQGYVERGSAFYSIRTYSYNNQYYRIFSNGWYSWRWRPWLFSCKLWISKVPKRCDDCNGNNIDNNSTSITNAR